MWKTVMTWIWSIWIPSLIEQWHLITLNNGIITHWTIVSHNMLTSHTDAVNTLIQTWKEKNLSTWDAQVTNWHKKSHAASVLHTSWQEDIPFWKSYAKRKMTGKWLRQMIILTYGTRFEVLLALAGGVAWVVVLFRAPVVTAVMENMM
jgi:hypothetical protein